MCYAISPNAGNVQAVKIRPYKIFWQVPNVYMACFANIWISVMHTST